MKSSSCDPNTGGPTFIHWKTLGHIMGLIGLGGLVLGILNTVSSPRSLDLSGTQLIPLCNEGIGTDV